MPSFRVAERWVRDRTRPEAVRFVAFCWAVESYCWLTGQRFHATHRRLGVHLGFDWEHKPSGDQMEAALNILDLERERVKRKRARFAAARRAEKHAGRRAWKPEQHGWVYEPDFLEVQHPAPAI